MYLVDYIEDSISEIIIQNPAFMKNWLYLNPDLILLTQKISRKSPLIELLKEVNKVSNNPIEILEENKKIIKKRINQSLIDSFLLHAGNCDENSITDVPVYNSIYLSGKLKTVLEKNMIGYGLIKYEQKLLDTSELDPQIVHSLIRLSINKNEDIWKKYTYDKQNNSVILNSPPYE